MLPSYPRSKLKGIGVARKAACFAVAWPLIRHVDKKNCDCVALVTLPEFTVLSKIWKMDIYSPKDLPPVEKIYISCNPSPVKCIALLLEEPLCLNNTKQLSVVTNQSSLLAKAGYSLYHPQIFLCVQWKFTPVLVWFY